MAEILKDEIMSDAELDGVAGGTAAEITKDWNFLRAVGALGQTSAVNDVAMIQAFNRLGIGYIQYGGDGISGNRDKVDLHNEYYINGKQVTREAALKAATVRAKPKFDHNTGEAMDYTAYL